ncbi:MAG: hypothetical protein AB7I68_13070 [Porticoccaceae bacterium]
MFSAIFAVVQPQTGHGALWIDTGEINAGFGDIRESAIERMSRDARVQSMGDGATEVMLEEVPKRSVVGRLRGREANPHTDGRAGVAC